MLFLLPPSETKLDGGSGGSRLDISRLAFPELAPIRHDVVERLTRLAADEAAAVTALKLGARQHDEVVRDRRLLVSPTMPALSRYTGVLFDPIDASGLSEASWSWADRHIVILSALFGPLRARDLIPAYRLSHDSRLPGRSLKVTWRNAVSSVLAETGEFVVDLRSEGYVGLGPVGERSTYVRVVSDAGGRRRALNHFNKKSKGLLVAALLEDRPTLETGDDLLAWCASRGIAVEGGAETVLVSDSLLDGAPVR
jgi:cytoplasmic iron level regulating protein YaaA (DUF328/UPF0246 family)